MPAQLGYQDALDLAQLMLSSPRDWLTRNFEDARLRTALASWGMHVDFSSDICVGAIRPHLVGYGSQLNGMALPKDDAGHVVSPLNLEQFNPDIVGGDQVCDSITCRRT